MEKEKNAIKRFDTTFCPPLIKIMYEDWSNKAILKIYNIIAVSKGVYNLEKIAYMSHTTKGTVSKSLKVLEQKGYIIKKEQKYYIHQVVEIKEENESFQMETKSFQMETKSFQMETNDYIYNNKRIKKELHIPDSSESAHSTNEKDSLEKNIKFDVKDKKRKSEHYKHILLSENEIESIKNYYYKAGLTDDDIIDGFKIFDEWAEENAHLQKFKKIKSHYRCMIGWVFEAVVTKKKKVLDLQRVQRYISK